jgi:hypothetical protein
MSRLRNAFWLAGFSMAVVAAILGGAVGMAQAQDDQCFGEDVPTLSCSTTPNCSSGTIQCVVTDDTPVVYGDCPPAAVALGPIPTADVIAIFAFGFTNVSGRDRTDRICSFLLSRDTISGGNGRDLISGGPGRDTISGDNGNDIVQGGDGDDTITGGAGDDSLDGNRGDDQINGGAGDDEIDGGRGDDILRGGAGDDEIEGDDGDDTILGQGGDDDLDGGDDNDTIDGGGGIDECDNAEPAVNCEL